jgi:hypothetical protein
VIQGQMVVSAAGATPFANLAHHRASESAGEIDQESPNPATPRPQRSAAQPRRTRFALCALRLAPSDCVCPSKPHWEWVTRITQSCNPSGTALACPMRDARSRPESKPLAVAYTNCCCGSLPVS